MTSIPFTQEYFTRLASLVEPVDILEKQAFSTRQLTEEELLGKRRCSGCNKPMAKLNRGQRQQPPSTGSKLGLLSEVPPAIAQPRAPSFGVKADPAAGAQKQPSLQTLRCRYHQDDFRGGVWLCCNKPGKAAEPCTGSPEHIPQGPALPELVTLYQYHCTPPNFSKGSDWRYAVALDCEMGTSVSGDSEPIRITMIDYFTQEILIDNFIQPDVPMATTNFRYSGVTWANINNARKNGTVIRGNAGARRKVWKYVGPGTLVIGHGLCNDLRSLRWTHLNVVDSYVIEFNRTRLREAKEAAIKNAEEEKEQKASAGRETAVLAKSNTKILTNTTLVAAITPTEPGAEVPKVAPVRKPPGNHSLKALATKYLGRDIQNKGKKGHDSLEDAIAARDVVDWNVCEMKEAWEAAGPPTSHIQGFNELAASGLLR